ncbi:MAG: FHA domain-containing protein [Candidatus Nanoarchaeia archaeon]|nr:FHA domain-containing protein [Candidatus Nanoarchaeia archaeon]
MTKVMYLLDRQTNVRHLIPETLETRLGRACSQIPISKEQTYQEAASYVSNYHCKLIRGDLSDVIKDQSNPDGSEDIGSGLSVQDIGSRNGTYVNGTLRNKGSYPLNNGDRLSLGRHYEFEVIIEGSGPLTESGSFSATVPMEVPD